MSLFDTLIPELQPWAQMLFDLASQAGVRPRVTSAFRTYAQQEFAYKAFVQGRSRYPAAPPGTSAHEYGYAFDLVVDNDVDQHDLGIVWKSWKGIWGGDFGVKDPIHFEFPGFRAPTAGTVPSDQAIPSSSSIRSTVERLADLIFQLVPIPLRGILNTAVISTQLFAIFGSDVGAAAEWMLTHPAELADFASELIQTYWKRVFGL